MDILWVVLHCFEIETASVAESNFSLGRLLAQFHINEQLLVDVEFLHDVDALANDALGVRVVIYEPLADHFGCHICDPLHTLHMLDAPHEPILFEVAFGTSVAIHLGLNHKFAFLSKIASKLTSHHKSFF